MKTYTRAAATVAVMCAVMALVSLGRDLPLAATALAALALFFAGSAATFAVVPYLPTGRRTSTRRPVRAGAAKPTISPAAAAAIHRRAADLKAAAANDGRWTAPITARDRQALERAGLVAVDAWGDMRLTGPGRALAGTL